MSSFLTLSARHFAWAAVWFLGWSFTIGSVCAQVPSEPIFAHGRLLFDEVGQPRGITYSGNHGKIRKTASIVPDGASLVPTGASADLAFYWMSIFALGRDSACALGGSQWLVASPCSGGGGSGLDLRVVRVAADGAAVVADGIVFEIVGPVGSTGLEHAAVVAWNPTTRTVRLVVGTSGMAKAQPNPGGASIGGSGRLFDCEVALHPTRGTAEHRDHGRVLSVTGTSIGAGAEPKVVVRRGVTWALARLDDEDRPFHESGHLVAYVMGADGRWAPQLVPSLRLPSSWHANVSTAGELLVSAIVRDAAGALVLRRSRLDVDAQTEWRTETVPLSTTEVELESVSWQSLPGLFPTAWSVNAAGRAMPVQ